MFDFECIKNDLYKLPEDEFIIKYYFRTDNWYLSEYLGYKQDQIHKISDNIKALISKELDIGFNNIVTIGSSKIGYSISPTKKLFQEFRVDDDEHPSDIDIALISNEIFTQLWSEFRGVHSITFNYSYNKVAKEIFRGFVNDKTFTEIDEIRSMWNRKVDKLNDSLVSDFGFDHQVNYRIYRSLRDLMDYQIRGLREIKEGNLNGV
ncbi:hypothetical protein D2A34_08630 [Clostridium chromiireducens]|uniref:Uncharacterized protein n=1 Tax=Clostridium chromiireducens TaxID=225345 RepID=A0A399IUU8_9CLOT|nr:hypothetical protein [Clostridium chromiireducens]RII35262.1 hypothetical protein D2A34_08630 [Clostridium chromiireducens]